MTLHNELIMSYGLKYYFNPGPGITKNIPVRRKIIIEIILDITKE